MASPKNQIIKIMTKSRHS